MLNRKRRSAPSAQAPSAAAPPRGHQHQRIDLEFLESQILDRFAQCEEPAEDIGRDVESPGHPLRNARCQFLDGEADAEQRSAAQRKDEFGVRTEQSPVGMLTLILAVHVTCVLVAFRVGFDITERSADGGFSGDFTIELNAHHTRGRHLRFKHPGQGSQAIADRARAARVADVLNLPQRVAVTLCNGRSGRMHDLADAR